MTSSANEEKFYPAVGDVWAVRLRNLVDLPPAKVFLLGEVWPGGYALPKGRGFARAIGVVVEEEADVWICDSFIHGPVPALGLLIQHGDGKTKLQIQARDLIRRVSTGVSYSAALHAQRAHQERR